MLKKMKRKLKPSKLGSVEKYELCKARMLKEFVSEFKKSSDPKEAFEKGKKSVRNCISSWEIRNRNQVLGLYGELVYFYRSFQEQQLTAEMAIGYKSDFRGKVLGRSAAIDVTTNPLYKDKRDDFESISGRLQNGWDYYVGVVDIRNTESEILPLLLPVCKDDNIGFFVLVFDDMGPSTQNLWGESSDLQQIIKFNPKCGGDDSDAVEEVTLTYNYIMGRPARAIEEIRDYHLMDLESTPKIEADIKGDVEKHFNDIVLFFRKLSGLTISAVVDTDEVFFRKDDVDTVTRNYWVHPHQYILKNLGKQGEIMDFNIAGYVHDYL